MKRFLIIAAAFLLLAALADVLFGLGCGYLHDHSRSGTEFRIRQAVQEKKADILIMGSSRAAHHFDTDVLARDTGLSAYNIGVDGNGILLMYGIYRLACEQHAPKLLIYELTPNFDIYNEKTARANKRYLSELNPYYRCSCLAALFDDVDATQRLRLHSGLYRYNSKILGLVKHMGGGR